MKEKCTTCKDKEVEKLDELVLTDVMIDMEIAMNLVYQSRLTPEQEEWLVQLNNRLLNDNKRRGCGKCMVQVKKNLVNYYNREITQQT